MKPFDAENDEILQASSDERESVKIIADLYIGDIEPGPVFMEIKSPRPNLDVCAESKKKILFFRTFFEHKIPLAFLAFPYNPFIYREKYSHAFTQLILDIDKEVLIGEEMWNKLGGEGAYEELLNIIEEVKNEIR